MKRSPRLRKTANLSDSVQHKLNMYALAAAGLGMLATAQPAEAKIVYTPAHMRLEQNTPPIPLDLNHDGIPDFFFDNHFDVVSFLNVTEAYSANEIWNVRSKGRLCAAALRKGVEVGTNRHFRKDPELGLFLDYTSFNTYFGPWHNVKHAYLGLKFSIKGKIHFGWASLTTITPGWYHGITATLTGYAYETIPGKAIIAGATKGPENDREQRDFGPGAFLTNPIPDTPQPASLGMLALGAQGVPLWRRKETQEARQ
jgi:hypothetical protein